MRWKKYDKPKFSKDVELRMPGALDKEKAEDNQTESLFNRGIKFSRFYWLQILSIRLSLHLSCFTFIFVPDDFAENRSVISSKGKGKFVRKRTGRSRSDRASRFAFSPLPPLWTPATRTSLLSFRFVCNWSLLNRSVLRYKNSATRLTLKMLSDLQSKKKRKNCQQSVILKTLYLTI